MSSTISNTPHHKPERWISPQDFPTSCVHCLRIFRRHCTTSLIQDFTIYESCSFQSQSPVWLLYFTARLQCQYSLTRSYNNLKLTNQLLRLILAGFYLGDPKSHTHKEGGEGNAHPQFFHPWAPFRSF